MADAKQKGKQGGIAVMAVIILLLSIVGAGAGFMAGSLLGTPPSAEAPKTDPAAAATAEAEKPKSGEGGHGEQPTADGAEPPVEEEEPLDLTKLKIIPIPPVLTTLAEPKGKWIRLEGSILAMPGGELSPELLAERSGEQILAYLRSLRLDQIEGPSGFQALRADLNDTVKALSKGEVQGVLIHGLIVE